MKGTKALVTREMDLMPPSSTSAVITASTMPTRVGEMPKVSCMAAATELDWVMLPMPKLATTAATAKNRARNLPRPPGMARCR